MNEETDYKVRIRQYATRLFMQYGIRSVSMDDIAEALGSSKKTLYNYYSDKNSLVEDVVDAILKYNSEKCIIEKRNASNAIEEAFLAIDHTEELFKRMNPLLLFDLKKYHLRAYKRFIDYKNEYLYKILKENINWGIKDGLFREDLNVEVVSRFRMESTLIIFMPDFYSKVDGGMAAANRELFQLFLYGMATPKGYELIAKYQQDKTKKPINDKN